MAPLSGRYMASLLQEILPIEFALVFNVVMQMPKYASLTLPVV